MSADNPTATRSAERNVAAIERAADVLFLFARSEARTLGVTEIASHPRDLQGRGAQDPRRRCATAIS